jgi:hypothetical protein
LGRKRRATGDRLGHIDPAALPSRWSGVVSDALEARRRWSDLLDGVRPGPVRDRLAQLATRVDDGVEAVWDTAVRLAEASRVAGALDADAVTEQYKRAKRDPATDPALLEALSDRFTSVQRVLNSVEDTDEQLRLLDARLGAAVAHAVEVALTAAPQSESAGAELDAVVAELGALRDSLNALG